MDETQTAKSSTTTTDAAEIREHDLRCVADHHVLDGATAIDQHADLAMQLGCLLRELACELRRHDIGRRNTTAIEPLECLDLGGVQTTRIARYLFVHARAIYPLRGPTPRI